MNYLSLMIQNEQILLMYFSNEIISLLKILYHKFNFCQLFSYRLLVFQLLEESILGNFIFEKDWLMLRVHIYQVQLIQGLKFNFLMPLFLLF
jgi:hypothetical protein